MKEVARQLNANKGVNDTKWDRKEGRIRCVYLYIQYLMFLTTNL